MTSPKKSPEQLRSYRWLGPETLRAFGHRSRLKQFGYDSEDWVGKPVIGIINTWSEINPCHGHLRERAEDVKRGVWQAGGFPIELPAMSLAEPFVKPSTMLYRNLLAMECEELLRSHPIDGAVLMGGCDKTTPGLIMGAISMGLPAIYVPAGPMLRGNWHGHTLGSGSDVWKYWDEKRAGNIGERGMERDRGRHRALVRHLHGDGHRRHHDVDHGSVGADAARRLVDPGAGRQSSAHVRGRRPPHRRHGVGGSDAAEDSDAAAFDNAIRVHMALGGSTNAIIHVIAMARRAAVALDMRRFDEISRQVPVIANITPSGKYLMEDFFYAGGLRALMAAMTRYARSVLPHRHRRHARRQYRWRSRASARRHPCARCSRFMPEGATAVLTGNLAPRGCVMKPAAADKRFLKHRGQAIAFENYDHMAREVERDDLEVTPDHVLVLKNAGPKGGPGMPEWGMLPIPKKLLKAGVRDMVRISDARMSGTSYGACILHVAPESFVGGPLALVQTGDEIEIDVAARRIHLHVSDEELARRRAAWTPPPPHYPRGYGAMYSRAHRPGGRRLRFRFSARHGAGRRAGDSLTSFQGERAGAKSITRTRSEKLMRRSATSANMDSGRACAVPE